jgi:Flp pilus assembly protein TadD
MGKMAERAATLGISKSLAPLRDVVASLAAARTGSPPLGADRRRMVRRVKAAGVAAVPALVRALGSGRADEATWAHYLLARLGGARVVERVSRLLEDPRAHEEVRSRALGLLADLNGTVPTLADEESIVERSVRQLLGSIEDADDMEQAVGLIARQVPNEELPAFVAELARHGGDQAAPLLEALAAALPGELSPETVEAIQGVLAQLADERSAACTVRTVSRKNAPSDERSRGLDLLEAGRLAESRRLLERVVTADPDDGEALSFLGVCCLELGDPEAALPYLERAIAVEPSEALHQWNLAAAAKAADQLCRCHGALTKYLALGDGVEGARARRREARGFVREYERTIQLAHPGVALETILDGEKLFLRAYGAFETGRHDEAAHGFREVIDLLPRHHPSWGNLGAAYFALGRSDEAQRCLKRALELKPDYEVARQNLARLEGNSIQ